jgi:prepilin-type N-terminal cleavage/methylation domain-containing protein
MKRSPFITNTQHNGFTLLEMLFAVIIFSFALVSLIGITGKGVIASITAKNQLVAQYLAEELIEVARNTRDSNYINGQLWLNNLDQCTEEDTCDIDYGGGAPTLLPGGGSVLYENGGVYSADSSLGGSPTPFSRELYFTSNNDSGSVSNQGTLIATVSWEEKGVNRVFELKTYIADWQTPAVL